MQDFNTPMMRQYLDIKKQYQDCLLFFRMGDFYELFLEDAHIGAKVLDIVLTSRAKGKDGRVPMAGVPYHAVDPYIAKLVKAGYKVAICEQITEPNKYGIVEREVIRIVTPGTILDEHTLDQKENNYIISLIVEKNIYGLAVADITTGLFQIFEFDSLQEKYSLIDELVRIRPSECVLTEDLYNNPTILKQLKEYSSLNIYCFHEGQHFAEQTDSVLKKQFGKALSIQSDIKKMKVALQAASVLIGYLTYTQKKNLNHFKTITLFSSQDQMVLDYSTILNLELFSTLHNKEKKGTLIHFLDVTTTAMGGRKLRDWLHHPLINKDDILKRHESVDELISSTFLRKQILQNLKPISDVERILSRLSLNLGNARDLFQLKESLKQIISIKNSINKCRSEQLQELHSEISAEIHLIIEDIEKHIVDNPPILITEGRMIKSGIDTELDKLHQMIFENKEWLDVLEKQERQRTGISSLKIRFNKVFGFYIEISKSNLDHVPTDYIRKQTLVNAERFITKELKQKEEIILSGEQVMFDLEYNIYKNLLQRVLSNTEIIQKSAQCIAVLDCFVSFASLSEQNHFVRPELIETGDLYIQEGRHPVVELSIGDEQFVPNDTILDNSTNQLLLITGPNMAGKSVYIRQVAVIVLLNQIGCFVPAKKAKLSVVDRIFVRSGASDMISEGLSTFMVEMVETAQILHKATSKSLVIMDEIGRGTSTYDGISIAWAIAEYVVHNSESNPKTLFATHYHELQDLETQYANQIKNYHMAIEDENGRPVFLYRLLPGGTSHSYGIAVAELAGIPSEVIKTAYEVLSTLEKRDDKTVHPKQFQHTTNNVVENKIETQIKTLDINNMTPLQALEILSQIKKKMYE